MICPRCNTANPLEARYCYRCGRSVSSPAQFAPVYEPLQPATLNQASSPVVTAAKDKSYPPYPLPLNGYQTLPQSPPIAPDSPLLQYHPLAEGAVGLPSSLHEQPKTFYSYVNGQEKLVFVRRASFGNRVSAALLDLVVLSIPYFVLAAIIGLLSGMLNPQASQNFLDRSNQPQLTATAGWLMLALVVVFGGYFFLTGLKSGQSLGKKVVNIRVIRFDGAKPDWLTAFIRFLPGYFLSLNFLGLSALAVLFSVVSGSEGMGLLVAYLAFGWGFWWCAWDELKQGWHDKLARTLVVETREYVEGTDFYRPARSNYS